jgi:cysteine desulfurase/selenocysteine lyase
VSSTTVPVLDAHRLRADFGVFDELVDGLPVAFLDSAASTQKPRQVLDRMRTFYEHEYANVHRGVYRLAERATEGFEAARRTVAGLLNAPSEKEIVFTRNATEAINLVAYAWGLDNLGPGDVVVITELEHHANFVPWQFVAHRTGASFRNIPIDDLGELQLDALDGIAREGNVKVVANNLVSNTLGTINPVETLAAWAHEQGAIMVVDAAQAAPHRRVDVQALGADFVAISSHKLCGPTGIGALWGKRELLEAMSRRPSTSCRTSSRRGRPRSRRLWASARRSTTCRPSVSRPSSATSTLSSSRRWPRSTSSRGSGSSAHPPTAVPESSRSTWRASTRTTSPRSSTGRASPCGPGTTARSHS